MMKDVIKKHHPEIVEAYKALGMNVPYYCDENGWSPESDFKGVQPCQIDVQVRGSWYYARPVLLNTFGLVYEYDLPDMTDEEYNEWFKTSLVVDGVRMGQPFIRN